MNSVFLNLITKFIYRVNKNVGLIFMLEILMEMVKHGILC